MDKKTIKERRWNNKNKCSIKLKEEFKSRKKKKVNRCDK